MPEIVSLEWTGEALRFLDQTKLPQEQAVVTARTYTDVVKAIRGMQVRGAPVVGVSGAYAMVLAAKAVSTLDMQRLFAYLADVAKEVTAARPTAANLQWAIGKVLGAAYTCRSPQEMRQKMEAEAIAIHRDDIAANREIGQLGADLLPSSGLVLTHGNTGALSTGGYGTALGVIRAAWEKGKRFRVLVPETRPLLQGARLTMWELVQMGIPSDLIVDAAAGSFLAQGSVKCVVVGADRIAANGDVANKIGTYTLAVVAHENGVPFYVVAPTSSIDLSVESGNAIPLEERAPEEVVRWGNVATTPKGISVRNPVFDVTPARYITAIVTERGILRPPYHEDFARLKEKKPVAASHDLASERAKEEGRVA